MLKADGRLVFSCPNGSALTNALDAYNLIYWLKRLFKPSAVRQGSMVRHLPARQILDHRPENWQREAFLRRGSLAFIYGACLADNLQNWRVRLDRRSRGGSWIAKYGLKPAIRLCFWIMKRDFSLSLGALSYNAVYHLRKTRTPSR